MDTANYMTFSRCERSRPMHLTGQCREKNLNCNVCLLMYLKFYYMPRYEPNSHIIWIIVWRWRIYKSYFKLKRKNSPNEKKTALTSCFWYQMEHVPKLTLNTFIIRSDSGRVFNTLHVYPCVVFFSYEISWLIPFPIIPHIFEHIRQPLTAMLFNCSADGEILDVS